MNGQVAVYGSLYARRFQAMLDREVHEGINSTSQEKGRGMGTNKMLKSTATTGQITVGTRRNTEDARRPDEIVSQQEA